MAILWADGFDDWSGVSNGYAGEYEAGSLNATNSIGPWGRRNGGAVYMNTSSDYLQKALPGSYAELFVSVAFRPTSLVQTAIVVFYSGATQLITLRINNDQSISACRGAYNGTVLGTSAPGVMPSDVFTHIQMRVVFSTTGGEVQVRLNGSTTPALSLTGQNTGGPSATAVRISPVVYDTVYYDDFVISDTAGTVANSWLGDVRVDSYLPNANGDLSQMVGADADSTNNFQQVAVSPPNVNNYVQSTLVGAADLYQVSDMQHNVANVYGVLCTAAARKDDAGARAIRLHCKSGGVDVASPADILLSTSRTRVMTNFEVDPATGLAWSKVGFNAAQFGFAVSA